MKSDPSGEQSTDAFPRVVKAQRAALRMAISADPPVDLKQAAAVAERPLWEALEAFLPQREGTRGQSWAKFVERAARELARAREGTAPDEVRAAVVEAESFLAAAVADMAP